MRAYKGFNKDMTCNGFQYEEGKTYENETPEVTETLFCTRKFPLYIFNSYNPVDSVYHVVELEEIPDQFVSKTFYAAKKIKIGLKTDIASLINKSIDFILKRIERKKSKEEVKITENDTRASMGNKSIAANTKRRNAAMSAGNQSAATSTGKWSASISTGKNSVAANTGSLSASISTGSGGVAVNTGMRGIAENEGQDSISISTGYYSASISEERDSVAINTGGESVSINNGRHGIAINTGHMGISAVYDRESISIAIGAYSAAAGEIGSWLILAECIYTKDGQHIKCIKSIKVDGKKIKPHVFYRLRNGKFIEAKNKEEETVNKSHEITDNQEVRVCQI